ncbi:MAG: SDR family oxidoreductase [Paludibacteraceae bacterium]|nr:SDR family oxidoreductase [Paludibacteraceae bacterium]
MNRFCLDGKTVLVTGASSGIGRAIAIACAESGANVILTGRNRSRLEETLLMMRGEEKHRIIPADLTDEAQRQALAEQAPALNGVVHCAGIGSRVLCKMLESNDVQHVMEVNFNAPVLLQAELLREKKIAKEASIVFIASAAATMPSVGNAIYSASKAATIAYAKCLAQELAARKIRVNCISPAMVWTDLALVGATEEQLREAEQAYPLKRYAQPEDIAPMAVYLLSDEAAWVTGSNMELTGGTQTL